jgi:hypothetical protein
LAFWSATVFFSGANKNWDTTATQLVGDSNLLVSKWLVARDWPGAAIGSLVGGFNHLEKYARQ